MEIIQAIVEAAEKENSPVICRPVKEPSNMLDWIYNRNG
jgi:Fructose/tagatose bisphosphate aldolase